MTDTVAQQIIDNLTDRRGFDAIWDECDSDTRKEILESIAKIIAATPSAEPTLAQPVAWRRKEGNAWWVYYEENVNPDLEPLYAAPPAPVEMLELPAFIRPAAAPVAQPVVGELVAELKGLKIACEQYLHLDYAALVDRTIAALERQAGEGCAWTQQDDEDSDLWETSCGHAWCINEGSPMENSMKFCHGCGKPIDQQPFKYGADPDDEPAHPSRSGGRG